MRWIKNEIDEIDSLCIPPYVLLVPSTQQKLGDDALKRAGSVYRFGSHVVAAAAGSSGGRAVTI